MLYETSLIELNKELTSTENHLSLFLKTNNNIYSFVSCLSEEEELEIINPIASFLTNKDYCKYDVLERRPNTIYYINYDMPEYESLDAILQLNKQIILDQVSKVMS